MSLTMEGVLTPVDSQRLHHQIDPDLPVIPRSEVRTNIEKLNMAGEFGAAELLLTEMAARRTYNEHRANPSMITRLLDRVLG